MHPAKDMGSAMSVYIGVCSQATGLSVSKAGESPGLEFDLLSRPVPFPRDLLKAWTLSNLA